MTHEAVGLMPNQRVAILVALAAVVAVSWLHLVVQAADLAAMGDPNMSMPAKDAVDLLLLLLMWVAMMAGMMLPSAAPMILTFAAVNRTRSARGQPYVPTALFASGYLLAWGGFSVAATAAQWGLERASLVSPMGMTLSSPLLGGLLFVLAGLYQFAPLKQACLRLCRSPFAFIVNHWQEGRSGALAMGARHGLHCLGCCWALMALLFVLGVMNLLWVGALAAMVLIEKLLPAGPWFAPASGVALVAWGVRLLTMG